MHSCSRSYFDLVNAWIDFACIHQLVVKPHSKAANVIVGV